MHKSTLYVFDGGDEFVVTMNIHPQVERMLACQTGTQAHWMAWHSVCGIITKVVGDMQSRRML